MSSGFVSEKDLAEARVRRQQEWEKVRTEEQPKEAPEETYDPRSLFERLDEQRRKRDLEFEESRKLKNMIKGLDDDEVDFLDLVDQKKLEAERNKSIDEERELLDYRNRVANLQEQSLEQRLQTEIKNVVKKPSPQQPILRNTRLSQNQLLKGLVIRKQDNSPKKRKADENNDSNKIQKLDADADHNEPCTVNEHIDKEQPRPDESSNEHSPDKSEMRVQTTKDEVYQCIGVLPGLGFYADSSSAASDTDSSDVEEVVYMKTTYDLVGRELKNTYDLVGRELKSKCKEDA